MINKAEFKLEVWKLADRISVKPKEVHVRQMKNKWASCSSNGRLTFDTSLLKQTDETRLKIVIHELLHLRYPNHGKMFNRLLEAYLRKELEF